MAAVPPELPGLAPPTSAPAAREPHLFRFGLRQMFAFVSGAAALVAAMAMIGGGWAATLGFAAALIAAHVLATSVGTRLRDTSRAVQRWNATRAGGAADGPPPTAPLTAADRAALNASPLALHEDTPRRSLAAAAAGLAAGATIGAVGIPFLAGPEASLPGIAIGAASCGVIGAWLALLAANFWTIARRAWRDANADATATSNRRRKRWWGPRQ